MRPRRLLAYLVTRIGGKNHDKNASSFLQLPVDVLLLIFNELPLYSKVFLSQTCSTMRSLLHSSCTLARERLSSSGCLEFLAGVADALPDYLLCSKCWKLHKVCTYDLPYKPYTLAYRCTTYSSFICHDFGLDYFVAHHHAQLALKYSRLQNTYQEYLASLMAPYSVTFPDSKPLMTKFSARPKIVDEKFILFSSWEFKDSFKSVSMENMPALQFCPHLGFLQRSNPNLPLNPLTCSMRSAFETKGLQSQGSCARCPTDYSVEVH
ncbi:hypothetical protein AOQ84DRAFT_414565 [Glonium stellatum]|uniref:F-box domain-containing protein n=1 Tax=Glonium stellatum TaxID=574774 RepID=A0A8E2JY64_9PEZI|nr:hypothetical protein AOQ84DRAFT_414565 [Glonium stellatum]